MNHHTNIPAIDCTLTGGYLMEASAGTGKTWTLTGIILRLIIEKKYAPERIIATTFTRASASEMQERVQARIHAFHRYLYWLNEQKTTHPNWFFAHENPNQTWQEIKEQAKIAGIDDFDDPINEYLIKQLMSDEHSDALTFAIRRCALLLTTLDKLFIGTLDSLAQKWMKEFADQMGHQADNEISANSDEFTHALIHDTLRREHVHLAESAKLYSLIGKALFSDTKAAYEAVKLALNFYDAPIDKAPVIDEGYLLELEKKLMSIMDSDLSVFEPFYGSHYMLSFGFKNTSICVKEFGRLKKIIDDIKVHQLDFIHHLSEDDIKFLNKLPDIQKESNFKKAHEDNKSYFLSLPIDKLLIISEVVQDIFNLPQKYRSYLYQNIAHHVRRELKVMLENHHKSTFTFVMVRLIEALESSPTLVRYIRHHYPVALIDESQDINGLQKRLIELVYLDYFKQRRDNNKKASGFLLLVGDPKQAIYRFRGGDVANYNSIKHFGKSDIHPPILNNELTLTVNRRSNHELIDSLNHWFAYQEEKDKFNPAYLGEDIYYQTITAHKEENRLSWQHLNKDKLPDYLGNKPLSLLHLPHLDKSKDDSDDKKGDEHKPNKHEYVARHINSLLQGNHQLEGQSILPNDIAVLARSKKDLIKLKSFLDKLGIPSVSPNEVNVFTTKAAQDIYALITAMMNQDRAVIGRLLITELFGHDLSELPRLLEDEPFMESVIFYLKTCHEKFIKYGIASALNYALSSHHPVQDETLWQLSARAGERYLTDLWQLTELISREYSHEENNDIKLLNFLSDLMSSHDDNEAYKQHLLPSESGVNLMTIHKSKGLEFPIVYVFGLEGKDSNQAEEVFYAYSDEHFHRRISPSQHKNMEGEILLNYYKDKNNKELLDERMRLGYVALTRASEQTFVVAQDLSSKNDLKNRPLFLWFDCDDRLLTLPERLINRVDVISLLDSKDMITDKYHTQHQALTPIHYQDWHEVFRKTDFIGASKTSATALMGMFDKQQNMSADHAIDDEVTLADISRQTEEVIKYPDDDIRLLFEKGVDAGTFLHRLLQVMNPSDANDISQCIHHQSRQLNFAHMYQNTYEDKLHERAHADEQTFINHHQRLIDWLYDISHTPMLASGVSLSQLSPMSLAKEMPFTLRLSEQFGIEALNQIFKAHSDKEVVLNEKKPSAYYKYLNGEMDLVYEHEGRFYVVDYKSNFIGERLSDYHETHLESAMNAAGYWLQASVYQVALHRLLKLRIKDYLGQEHRYLGGVEFIFLRGVDRNYPKLGHIHWQPPLSLIHALDELFG